MDLKYFLFQVQAVIVGMSVLVNMLSDDDVLIAVAAFIVVAKNKNKIFAKPRRFWVRPSLQSRDKYSTSDLTGDLVSNDVNILNLECNGIF